MAGSINSIVLGGNLGFTGTDLGLSDNNLEFTDADLGFVGIDVEFLGGDFEFLESCFEFLEGLLFCFPLFIFFLATQFFNCLLNKETFFFNDQSNFISIYKTLNEIIT